MHGSLIRDASHVDEHQRDDDLKTNPLNAGEERAAAASADGHQPEVSLDDR